MPKRGKAGSLHIRQRGKKRMWYVYGYGADGKQFGKSLGTTSKATALEQLKQIRAQLTLAKAKKHLTWEEEQIKEFGYVTYPYIEPESPDKRLIELLETEHAKELKAELERKWLREKRESEKKVKRDRIKFNPKVEDFFPIYLEYYSKTLRPGTLKSHRNAWNRLLEFTKPKRLGDIDTALMRKFLSKCEANGISLLSAINYAIWIQGIARKGIDSELYRGPRLKLPKEMPRNVRPKRAKRPLTKDQAHAIIEAAKPDEGLYLCISLCYYAGTRKGEACNLLWEEIDLERNRIHLQAHPEVNYELKSKKNRFVTLSPALKETLLPFRQESGYVVNPDKTRSAVDNAVGRRLRKIADSMGLNWCVMHTFRTSFASHLATQGTPDVIVAEWLGHSHVNTTRESYITPTNDGMEHIKQL